MRTPLRPLLLATLTLLVPTAAARAAAADDGAGKANRTLQHATTITRPGLYIVGSDFAVGAGETAIVVRTDDVTLDLGGHTLRGPGGPGSVGIELQGASNVTVRDGALAGFGIGAMLDGVVNARLEHLRIDGEDLGGSPPEVEVGVLVLDSRGVVVADNVITDTFLGIFVRGSGSGGNRIAGNTITGGQHGELGICYNPAPGAAGGGPRGDLVYANLVSLFNRGIAFSADSRGNVARENTFATFGTAVREATTASNAIDDNVTTQLVR